jgi:acyl carrier protein
MDAMRDKIRDFIVENFLFGDDQDLKNDTSFLESGIIDSTGILELVTFLDETFNIEIADEELVPENLDSINLIVAFLARKVGHQAAN